MSIVKFFKIETAVNGKYIIKADPQKLKEINGLKEVTIGSFNVLQARVLNLSYKDYLKMCRDEFDAEIIGKGKTYPVAYFDKMARANLVVKMLNHFLTLIKMEKDFLDKEWSGA